MKNHRLDLLYRPLFILALGLLLLNDFHLKYEYTSFLTGKLSDIAGLFLFPYFLSSLWLNRAKSIYIGTALLFIFWKSPLSQEIIDWGQSVGIGFNRVVDYGDFFTLLILPLSFLYFKKQLLSSAEKHQYISIPIGLVSLFAIWATTLPRAPIEWNLEVDEVYELEMSKAELFRSLYLGHGYSDTLQRNLSDSLFYLYFDINDNARGDVTALVTITSVDIGRTRIKLNKVLSGSIEGGLFSGVDQEEIDRFSETTKEKFKSYFEANFINRIKAGSVGDVFFDNKLIHDSYQYA